MFDSITISFFVFFNCFKLFPFRIKYFKEFVSYKAFTEQLFLFLKDRNRFFHYKYFKLRVQLNIYEKNKCIGVK